MTPPQTTVRIARGAVDVATQSLAPPTTAGTGMTVVVPVYFSPPPTGRQSPQVAGGAGDEAGFRRYVFDAVRARPTTTVPPGGEGYPYSEGVVDNLPTKRVIELAIVYAAPVGKIKLGDVGFEALETAIGRNSTVAAEVLNRADTVRQILEGIVVDHRVSPEAVTEGLTTIEPEIRDVLRDALNPVSKAVTANKLKALRDVSVWAMTQLTHIRFP